MAARTLQITVALALAAINFAGELNVEWRERAAMPLPRAGYMAGTDGRRLLLAGGSYWEAGRKIWSDRANWYDPATDRWQPAASLPAPLSDAAFASFEGGIYIFGGGEAGHVRRDALVLRDGTWHALPAWSLPAARLYAAAAVLSDRIYVVGGLPAAGDYAGATATVWSRPLRGNAGWRVDAEIPGPRRVHFALAAHGGRLYLFGGMTQRGGELVNLSDADEYDPAIDRWRVLSDAPIACRAWWAVPWQNRILLLGGYTDRFVGDIYSFDPKSDRYTHFGTLPRPVADARFVVAAKQILTAGGESGPKIRAPWTWVGLAVP